MSNPLICCEFDDSRSYFAFALVALDTHQVKVVSVNSTSESSLDTSLNLDSDSKVSGLTWIPFQEEELILAVSLTNGSIILFSPQTNTVITRLSTSSNSLITDFQYSKITNSLWASDITGVLYEWDMYYNLSQKFSINDSLETAESISKISVISYNSTPHMLAGSHSVYLVNINTKEIVGTFPAHIESVRAIQPIPFDNDLFLTSALGDRFINLYSISKRTTKQVFVTASPVLDISIGVNDDKSVLIAKTEAGTVEVFNLFLEDQSNTTPTNSKKKRRQLAKSRHSNASFSLERPVEDITGGMLPQLPVAAVAVKHNLVVYCWLENSNVPIFDSLKWLNDSGSSAIVEPLRLIKKKTEVATPHHALNGHDVAAVKHYNEGNAVISDGYNLTNVVEDGDDDDEDGESLADKVAKLATETKPLTAKKARKNNLSNNTLTTVLSQSLKNNDHSLLETVLTNRDQQVIQNTISKLDSSLAIILLDRISERIARQANRFDQLVYWLKWIIIIHGGILSSLPGLSSKLSNLHGILSKKADTLPRLMQLQAKMQIIYEQSEIKRHSMGHTTAAEDEEDDEDTDIEYIEELDDAKLLNGGISESDEYMNSDGIEDVDMDDSEEEEASDKEQVPEANGKVSHDEGYSDEEIGVDMPVSDDEEH